MLSGLTGRRPVSGALTRGGLLAASLVLALGLGACTTTEGTNALTDIATFEREVAIETMQGMGMMEREQKNEDLSPRGPLVMPKSAALPPPQQGSRSAALLPEDSSKVRIDASGLGATHEAPPDDQSRSNGDRACRQVRRKPWGRRLRLASTG